MARLLQLFLPLTILSAVGCTSLTPAPSPETKYFVLDALPHAKQPPRAAKRILLAPVRLPAYLNQQQLVVREKNHQIRIAKYHSWAEPLKVSIRRSLETQLNHKNLGVSFVDACTRCPRLLVDIHHFYPTVDGEVLLSGGFRLDGSETEGKDRYHAFHYREDLREDGYAASVREMRGLLGDLANTIAETLKEHAPK